MELIDIYDDLGQKSGKSEDKDEAHSKALLHRGGCVWIMNSKREILLRPNFNICFPAESMVGLTDILKMKFKMMVESCSSMLLPYETHYRFLLIVLNSRLMQ